MTDDRSRFDDWARLAAKELKDTPAIRGMIRKVSHLVEVEPVE